MSPEPHPPAGRTDAAGNPTDSDGTGDFAFRPPGGAPGRWAATALRYAAATLLFAMMAVTLIDVAGRDLLARPLPGAFELTEVLVALVVFAGLPLVSSKGQHVAASLIDRRLPPRALRLRARLVAALGAAILAVIAWRLWVLAARLAEYGDTFEFIGLPQFLLAYAMAVLAAVAALAMAPAAFRR